MPTGTTTTKTTTAAALSLDKESDIDGTTNRVASFTLESDSLSEAPRSFHSKRRKRLPKREKFSRMDVDVKRTKQLCLNPSECSNKLKMDWEATISDIDFSSNNSSQSSDEPDADDEQSDWPEAFDLKRSTTVGIYHHPASHHPHSVHNNNKGTLQQRSSAAAAAVDNPGLDANVLRRIERFISDSRQQELILSQVYRTSVLKKLLKHTPPVQILRRGRGTIVLKKA